MFSYIPILISVAKPYIFYRPNLLLLTFINDDITAIEIPY